ncbi:hypothetical protein [Brucella anthropi]|uniref:hypothetical protein n=1 Tax=Brucella anthropi TaxID=529 RepID=UPI00178C2F8C|nr:hypothetical protein [Brucella anthropi]
MAVLSDYTSGTISLANGSATVTGTGTLFEVTRFREGDTLQIQNLTAVIASVDSDTQLTLTEPWTGTSIVDGPYRARQLADGTRVGTQAATLIELLGDGTLAGIAALGVEEGKVPVGGPVGQYVLADMVTDPNGSLGKLAALTLAARQILQTDAAGDLKQIALAANKALATDANGDVTPIDLGTLGGALLALATGTTAQYLQGDGTLQAKAGLPISTATQTALNGKFDKTGGAITGGIYSNSEISTASSGGSYSPAITTSIGTSVRTALITELSPGQYSQAILQTVQDGTTAYNFAFRYGVGFISPGVVNGTVKNFEIDHPIDPDNYDLRHAATESPELLVEYRGTAQLVNGRATVNVEEHYGVMPDTFVNLWIDAWVISLQNQDGFDRIKPSRVTGATFEIICENEASDDLVSWVVMARRNDPYVRWEGCPVTDANGKLIIEFEKDDV